MTKIHLILLSLVLSTNLWAAGSIDRFIDSLKDDYFFTKTERAKELHHHIRITAFGPLGRIFSPDAIATYNDRLNSLSLDPALIHKVGGSTHIRSSAEIRGPQNQSYHLSTIFHELGHAEMDVFVEEEREAEDSMLMHHYKTKLKPFYKNHFGKFNSFVVFHEHFGYYRGELIDFMENEIFNVLLNNGFNRMKNSCYLNPLLRKKLADGIGLEEFKQFFVIASQEELYRHQINPQYLWVKGKDIHLYGPQSAKLIIPETHQLFWTYHQSLYHFPINQKDLVKRMNQGGELIKKLSQCREQLWNNRSKL